MIYRKTRLGIQIEPGSRNYLLQSNEDKSKNNHVLPIPGSETDIQDEILIGAVSTLTYNHGSSGITKEELELLKDLDGVLDKVKLVVDKKAENFYFADDAGSRFTMPMGKPELTAYDPQNMEHQDEILRRAYQECTKDYKLTKKEIELIGKIDDVLPDAAITINPRTGDATIISNKGGYDIPFPKDGGKGGR